MQPPTPGIATSALVLGILSVTCLGCFAGVPAIVCGHMAQSRISQSSGTLGGAGISLAGLIMGYVSLGLTLFVGPLLAAIAVPNFIRAKHRAESTRVLADCRALQAAANAYLMEYGRWPGSESEDREVENAEMMNALRGSDRATNPRKVVFYEADPSKLKDDQVVDVWGRPFHFALDGNRDNAVAFGDLRATSPVAVWSDGPNGLNEYGEGDDVTSWKALPFTGQPQ